MIAAVSLSPPPATAVPADQLVFDHTAVFPLLGRTRDAAVRGDWSALVEAYKAADGWPMRNAVVRTVAETSGIESLLQQVVNSERDNTLPRFMLAVRHIELGWNIRTELRAEHVSRDQFAMFHDHLRIGERSLIEITAQEPEHIAAWTWRLITARGLELGQAEARRRYDQLAKHDPHSLSAQVQLLQQLCPKWSGSVEEMLGFARERAFAAPEGALNGVLIVDAHLECWSHLQDRDGLLHLRNPAVQQEVARAAARSVLHPSFRPTYNWILAHASFALYHSLVGNFAAAAVHFRAMGPYASQMPWKYFFGQPEKMFHQHRAEALAKG
jgi:hypothetical protein